jgi:hypothetical protein
MLKQSLCLLAVAIAAQSAPTVKNACRFMPNDPEWPSAKTWDALNKTVHGQLIATVPIAAPCHDSTAPKGGLSRNWPAYDEQKCTDLQERWLEPELQYVPRSIEAINPLLTIIAMPTLRASWRLTSSPI